MLSCLSETKLTLPSVTLIPERVHEHYTIALYMCMCVCVCMRAIMSEDCACNPVILQD